MSGGCVFLLLRIRCVFVKFDALNFNIYEFEENGQMDRGNENPIQYLPWRLRETTEKPADDRV